MRLFGTNGIREVVGDRLTAPFATAVAAAIGATFPVAAPIAVGWDGRTSSPALSRIMCGTLALSGHRVIDLGVLPTPAIQLSVPRLHAQLGVIITASHNPPEFNGVKCIAEDGLEVEREVEERIETAIASGANRPAAFDAIGGISRDRAGASRYIEGILSHVDPVAIAHRRFTVVLDCGNGASTGTSPELLRRLGCRAVTLNGHLDGLFPGRRSEPTEANLGDLLETVKGVRADLGVAHDGDADRAVFVDATGRFVPGEKILTLLARDRVRRHRGGTVVTPVTGSQSVEDAIRPLGGEVVYTRVGSPSVTHEMKKRSAVFGGEENGGLVFPELQLARDGAMTMAAVLDYLARESVSLADSVADLPSYVMVKHQVACPVGLGPKVIDRLTEVLRSGAERVVTLDGIKVYKDGGWLLLRPSGTESLVRIFAESREAERAQSLAEEGTRRVVEALHELEGSASR